MTQTTATPTKMDDPYYSRIEHWEPADRVDPVVWNKGQISGPWSDDLIASYEKNGYLFQPRLFSEAEAEEMLAEANRLADDVKPQDEGVIAEPDSNVVRSLFRLHEISELFRFVCRDGRLVDAARQVLGSEVYIHQSRINYKPAFDGKEFFWHSDFETWHIEDGMPRMRALSAFLINLTENNEFNGPLMVVARFAPDVHPLRWARHRTDHFQQIR